MLPSDQVHDETDLECLVAYFEQSVWMRGIQYARDGRVERITSPGPNSWKALVCGSATSPYITHVRTAGAGTELAHTKCSCPAKEPCKHAAALLIRVANVAEDAADLHEDATGRQHFSDWLADLEMYERVRVKQQELGAAHTSLSSTHRLLFVLSIEPDSREPVARLRVQPTRVRVLKNGGFSAYADFDLGRALAPSNTSAFVTQADRNLWRRVLQDQGQTHTPFNEHGSPAYIGHRAADLELVSDLIATGRAYMEVPTGPPLKLGGTRSGELVWTREPEGLLRLAVRVGVEDAHDQGPLYVLPTNPVFYADHRSGEAGILEIDSTPARVAASYQAPLVAAGGLGPGTAKLAKRLSQLGLPVPPARAIRHLRGLQPQAHLRLSVDRPPDASDGNGSLLADLTLCYGPLKIAVDWQYLHSHHTSLVVEHEGDLVHLTTNDAADRALINETSKIGFAPGSDYSKFQLVHGVEQGQGTAHSIYASNRLRRSLGREPTPADRLGSILDALQRLEHQGWNIEYPPELAPLRAGPDAYYFRTFESEGGWFELDIGVEVEGATLSIVPAVLHALRTNQLSPQGLADGESDGPDITLALDTDEGQRLVTLPRERLAKIVNHLLELFNDRRPLDGRLRISRLDTARLAVLDEVQWHGDRRLIELAKQLTGRKQVPEVKPPRGLRAELRDYQLDGLRWLAFLRSHGFGGVLADDMGLGKTVQTLAHLLREKQARRLDRPCLVVAPRTVIHNWQREAQRFTPTLSCEVYHGAGRRELFERDPSDLPNLIVTTYALLTRDDVLSETQWHVVVLDEAQAIKNPTIKVARRAQGLDARQRLCLTGTPMENNLEELWSLFHFIAPGLLGGLTDFRAAYRRPIERDGDVERMRALSARTSPFMLRRTKSEVLAELPPKIETLLSVPLEKKQRDLYESVRLTMEKKVRDAVSDKGLGRSQIVVLDALLKLRQVCCHPALVPTDLARRSKAQSAKTLRLMEILAQLHAAGRRTLVFSQFTTMLAIISEELEASGIPHRKITGRTRKRQAVVDAFQAGEFPVLLISLKAGGTGINLTAADTVIHYDPWWNPAVEAQATDRAHRMGQTQPVTVYRFVCEGTVEERILALQARKRALTQALQAGAEARSQGGFGLSDEDLNLLLAPLGDPYSSSPL